MIEDIEAVIKDAAARFSDRRLNLFEVKIESGEGGWIALSGKVLEQSNLEMLRHALHERLPELDVDDSGIRVLHQPQPHLLTVATNITSLHVEPYWLSEMLSQNTYGAEVEVLEEQGRWVRVRQVDGYLGWMYRPYLNEHPAPQPTYLVSAPMTLLHVEPNRASALTSRLLGGTGVQVVSTKGEWAEVDAHVWGWVQMKDLRALDSLPRSTELVRTQMMSDAPRWMGVPYLWGGTSAHGIDCSGFAQLIHRLAGLAIPRDADLQFDAGRKVEPPFQPGDLLFFGEQGEKRSITHVGICVGGWQMIHSSRSRNGVQVDDVQNVEHLHNSFIGAASFVP